MPQSKEQEALSAYVMREITAIKANARSQCTWRQTRESLSDALAGSESGGRRARALAWLEGQLTGINSPDELFVLFGEMERVQERHFDDEATVSSIFGSFLAQACLVFESLFFDGVSRLFLSIQEWAPRLEGEAERRESLLLAHCSEEEREEAREELEAEWESPPQGWEATEAMDFPALVRLRSLGSSTPHGVLSAAEVELFVAQEARDIQGLLWSSGGERGSGVREREVRERIEELRRLAPTVAAVHYLSLVFEIQQRNVSRARDELHRYFDRQVFEHAARRKRDGEGGKEGGNKRSSLLPFALLNLASLHFLFSDFDEGVQAVSEAVRLAQANSDQGFLALGLTWLQRLLQQQLSASLQCADTDLLRQPLPGPPSPLSDLVSAHQITTGERGGESGGMSGVTATTTADNGERLQRSSQPGTGQLSASPSVSGGGTSAVATTKFFLALLERCVAMAEKESLPYLSSLNNLSVSALLLHTGAPVVPVTEPSDIPLFTLGESNSALVWQVLQLSDRQSAHNGLRALAAKAQLMRSSAWADYGHRDLSRLYAAIPLLTCAPAESKIAHGREGYCGSDLQGERNRRGVGMRERLLERQVQTAEEFAGACCKLAFQLSEEGKGEAAATALRQLETLLPVRSMPREQALAVTNCWLQIRVREALNRGENATALLLIEESHSLPFRENLLSLDVARELCRLPAAVAAANRMLESCTRAFDADQRKRQIPLLLWTARAHRESGDSALALRTALRALSLCHESHLFAMKAAACLELAAAHLALRCPSRAVAIVQALLPQILRHSPLRTRGEAHLLLARALAARARVDRTSAAAQRRTLTAALPQLSSALLCFRGLSHLSLQAEALHLRALLYAALGEEDARDAAAAEFLAVREESALRMRFPRTSLPGRIR
eukprot:CAMPEP_0114609462 /NCGR_PEP_ID=MMETSP0168-20121206/3101_1 /TAXON_ID=95228 ORGANISM="Vannella sp., Strain DIVA3 517/6/12" /NCGR_SAMPLE_ID=MMETSP0168 /ASSEMBLY_ACC=CAM_ASM_000044 /LENGTH=902 /DNA_ID=CAMNT_0001820381 /DNA_START=178 /DNA_END=2883 /DNA_ORIENTATION=+